jgi:hypothetical protein
MPDGGARRTRADTGATQTKVRRCITSCHQEWPEKGGAWPTRTPNSKELTGAWEPRTDLRRPTRSVLAAAGAEDDGKRGWGRVSVRSRRGSVDLASKIKDKR